MARAPDGTVLPFAPCEELGQEENGFVSGLEGVIDRALQNHPPGERFVFGIHQALSPSIERCLLARYRTAGWGEARVIPGATGAATLVLAA